VLALWVILHHLTGKGKMLEPWAQALPLPLATLIRAGYLAVATFFVLSGFVLARSYSSTRWTRASLLRYGANRLARIYPVYALSVLIIAPIMFADPHPLVSAAGPSKAGLIADYVLVLQGWAGALPVHWNTPAWSLTCEIFFYLCFPLAVFFMARMGWRATLLTGIAACIFPHVAASLGMPDAWKPLVHFPDFVIGIATANVYPMLARKRALIGRGYLLYLPAIALALPIIADPDCLGGSMSLNTALRPLSALLLGGLALGGGLAGNALSRPLAVELGHASYAMYILHIPMLWWYKRWIPPVFHTVPSTWLAVAYVGLVIVLSAAVFRYFEQPANRYLRRRFEARYRV
jgi:peptidoglycan/LPS O-acetylase OafA/YrhL